MNPANHQDAILGFHFTGHIRGQAPAARVDLARLQRASECSCESTGGRGNDIIQGCGMRWISIPGNLVMFSDLGMYAEDDRLFLCG